jgi:hypothetical protein
MTNQEILKHHAEMKAFGETKAGAAMMKFERLLGNAWDIDQRATSNTKSVKKAWKAADEAREELIVAIKELQKCE